MMDQEEEEQGLHQIADATEEQPGRSMTEAERNHRQAEVALECLPGYLTVRMAARMIGVSERSVYDYVEDGKLPAFAIGKNIVVSAEHVRAYERKGPGRQRVSVPLWRTPPPQNRSYLTIIRVQIRPGQRGVLYKKLQEMRKMHWHLLSGTTARYIACNRCEPGEVMIVLVWREAALPPVEVREAALNALCASLDEALAWETAVREDDVVLLHA